MRDNPNWRPQRIVASVPAGVAQQMPEMEALLRRSAGAVELVIDKSETMVPSAEILAGADAYIGLCTQAALANASPRLLWVHSYTAGIEECAGLPPEQLQGRVFTNSKRLASPAIAEHAMAMLLSLSTGLPAYHRAQLENRWDRSRAAGARFRGAAGQDPAGGRPGWCRYGNRLARQQPGHDRGRHPQLFPGRARLPGLHRPARRTARCSRNRRTWW